MLKKRFEVWVVIGTRPEAIKMCPVIKALRAFPEFNITVCFSGQHPDMVMPVMALFEETINISLSVMTAGQTLASLSAKLLSEFDNTFGKHTIDALLVHGDTTTSSMAALSAYYHKIPVGHVESGLRTSSIYSPWPEEGNRRLNAVFSKWHFAPTDGAVSSLVREGVNTAAIEKTGNTVIDALYWALDKLTQEPTQAVLDVENTLKGYAKTVLVTAHRRENHGDGVDALCQALVVLSQKHHDVAFVYPVHPNPRVSGPVRSALSGIKNIFLLPPQPYDAFVVLMQRSMVIITDSGGIQEEAPALGVPIVVCRDSTERPEAVESGWARLAGMKKEYIEHAVDALLQGDRVLPNLCSPYGDGLSAMRIARRIYNDLTHEKSRELCNV